MVVSALILNVLVFAALVLFLISRGYLSIYSGLFLYLAFHFIAFVQRPLAVYLFDIRSIFTYMKYMPDDYGFIQALFVANVGLFSFVFFYLAALQVGTRWPIVIAMLVLIMMVLYLHRRRSFTLTHYALMAFVLVAFIMVGHNREALVRLLLNGEIEFHFDLARSSFGEHPDFSLFECLTYIIAKVPTVSQT